MGLGSGETCTMLRPDSTMVRVGVGVRVRLRVKVRVTVRLRVGARVIWG